MHNMNNETSPKNIPPGQVKTGLNWVIGSFYLFSRSPTKWLLVSLAYVLLFLVLPALPHMPTLIALLVILIWPGFIAVTIGLYREADQGRVTALAELIEQIKPYLGRLISLGGICLLYGVLMGMVTRGDSQALGELINQKTDPQLILTQALPLMIKLCILVTPLVMATWFSPMLIAYQEFSVAEAIKHSIWASWRNLVALGVAWLGLTIALVAVMLVAGIIVGMIGALSQTLAGILMSLVALASFLLATSFLLAIQYLSYRHEYYQQPLVAEAGDTTSE
jgi:hypothetical protein